MQDGDVDKGTYATTMQVSGILALQESFIPPTLSAGWILVATLSRYKVMELPQLLWSQNKKDIAIDGALLTLDPMFVMPAMQMKTKLVRAIQLQAQRRRLGWTILSCFPTFSLFSS